MLFRSRELWNKVQILIAERTKPFSTGETGLFARKARCISCGCTMRSRKMSDGRRYLCCSNRQVSKEACEGAFISVAKLEQAVIEEISRLSAEYLDKDGLEEQIICQNHLAAQKNRLEKEIAAYQKKESEYAASIRELYLDKVKNIISESEYLDFSKEFISEKKRFESLALEAERQLTDIEVKMRIKNSPRQLIDQYTSLKKLDHETVDKLIDFISVGRRIPGTKDVPIEIHWNF